MIPEDSLERLRSKKLLLPLRASVNESFLRKGLKVWVGSNDEQMGISHVTIASPGRFPLTLQELIRMNLINTPNRP